MQTPEHNFIALNRGIKLANQLYRFLKIKGKFSDDKLTNFGLCMRNHQFPGSLSFASSPEKRREEIASQKKILDYIIANRNRNDILVTKEMIEQFQQQYKLVPRIFRKIW